MYLKTKQMKQIFLPIDEQIRKLLEPSNTNVVESANEITELKKCIVEQLNSLLENFDNVSNKNLDSYENLKKNITFIVKDLCTMNFHNKLDSRSHTFNNELFTDLKDKFLLALINLEKMESFALKIGIQECLKYAKEMGAAQEVEDFRNVKELGMSIADIVESLLSYHQNLISSHLAEKIVLYYRQLYASFSLLVLVVKEQYRLRTPIYMCKKYVCERICLCLESILDILDYSQSVEESDALENNFVFSLETVLDIITTLSKKSQKEQIEHCDRLWLGIEDIFTHAMAIAQICQPNSFKAINGSCQTVLTEYENLKTQLQSDPPDQTMNDLFINTLTDSLYRLEQKINISVLTLVMEVFSDPFGSLKKLIKICGSTLTKEREKSDLTTAIEEFDQIVDKSVQIGKFAIACCRDKKKNTRIKNCLASFESLEMELIPAVTAFYLHPENQEMHSTVKLLTSQWQLEMNEFHHTINLIIDPVAYCQIILDDLQNRVSEISGCSEDNKITYQTQVKSIVQRALSLFKLIDATVEDLGRENVDKHVIMSIHEFKAVIYETDAASKKFVIHIITPSEQLRITKRCEIMLKIIKRLSSALSVIVDDSITINNCNKQLPEEQNKLLNAGTQLNLESCINRLSFDENSASHSRTPYSVKIGKQPLEIKSANPVSPNDDLSIWTPYIQKGQLMRNEWSVMYKSPNKCRSEKRVLHASKQKDISSVRQYLFSRNTFHENDSTTDDLSSFDLSDILEGISDLSDTFSPNTETDFT